MMPAVSRTFQVGLRALLIILSLFSEIGDEKVLVQNPPGYVPIVLRSLQYYLIMINWVHSNLRSSYKNCKGLFSLFFTAGWC
jgi:hypothetical protein